jgi:hypothetical protein
MVAFESSWGLVHEKNNSVVFSIKVCCFSISPYDPENIQGYSPSMGKNIRNKSSRKSFFPPLFNHDR